MARDPMPRFVGEIVKRRHPVLIAMVFVFAVFLAAAPFFYGLDRSPYTDSVALYDDLCRAASAKDAGSFGKGVVLRVLSGPPGVVETIMAGFECVDRSDADLKFDTVPGRAWGDHRAYDLTITPTNGRHLIKLRFEYENEKLKLVPNAYRTNDN